MNVKAMWWEGEDLLITTEDGVTTRYKKAVVVSQKDEFHPPGVLKSEPVTFISRKLKEEDD